MLTAEIGCGALVASLYISLLKELWLGALNLGHLKLILFKLINTFKPVAYNVLN